MNGANPDRGHGEGGRGALAAAVIVLAAIAAYSRSFTVPMLYDDVPTIAGNPTIRHWASALAAPDATTAGGRPVLNLSLALNYRISGTSVWSYHALNLAIHAAAGLVLLGVVRRTLAPRAGEAALPMAFAASLLWVVHPLQTEAVTYIVQRAESLMGLFYLLTLYGFIRAAEPDTRSRAFWTLVCVGSCALGMGTKEVMATAPLIVLLYDRTFVSWTFAESLRSRKKLYAALAATWVPLAFLVASSHGRGGTAGSGAGVEGWRYAIYQFHAVAHYLRLAAWPSPLVFDYGRGLSAPTLELSAEIGVVAALAAATAWALARRPAAGFLGVCFFAILAPSSSIVPVATEAMAEHRMYLPLAAVLVMAVVLLHRWLGQVFLPLCLALSLALLAATVSRNGTYQSALSIWRDTAAKCPSNERAHSNLGAALLETPGHGADALAQYQEALRLKPDDAEAENDLGSLYMRMPGGRNDAIVHYQTALRLRPAYAEAHNNLGSALAREPSGLNEAVSQYEAALRLRPDDPEIHTNLGSALAQLPGRLDEAIAQHTEALRLDPGYAAAHNNLGNALARLPNRNGDAIAQYREALRLDPADAEVHNNLGYALSLSPARKAEAAAQYQEALRLRPDFVEAHRNLARAWAGTADHGDDALGQFEEALRLDPSDAETHFDYANALMGAPGRSDDAITEYERALRLNPNYAQAHNNLGYALMQLPGRERDAMGHFMDAIRVRRDYPKAHLNLGVVLSGMPGASESAAQEFKEVISLDPDNVEARLRLAVILMNPAWRRNQARVQLMEVLRLDPDNAEALRLLSGLPADPP